MERRWECVEEGTQGSADKAVMARIVAAFARCALPTSLQCMRCTFRVAGNASDRSLRWATDNRTAPFFVDSFPGPEPHGFALRYLRHYPRHPAGGGARVFAHCGVRHDRRGGRPPGPHHRPGACGGRPRARQHRTRISGTCLQGVGGLAVARTAGQRLYCAADVVCLPDRHDHHPAVSGRNHGLPVQPPCGGRVSGRRRLLFAGAGVLSDRDVTGHTPARLSHAAARGGGKRP